jgi:enoyl-CoA hydratase
MTHPSIKLERRDDVAVLSLDDSKANALNRSFMQAFREALVEAASSAGAVVLAGRAGFFSGGLDIKLLPTLPHAERVETVRELGAMLLALFTLERPVVACLTGHALAGGALVALACDVRVAADLPKARFGLNEVAIGLALPTFGVEIARAVVPVEHLTELVLHARTLSMTEAHARRIVQSLHAPDEALNAAVAHAQSLAGLAREAYAPTKQRLRGPTAALVRASLDGEIESFLARFAAM